MIDRGQIFEVKLTYALSENPRLLLVDGPLEQLLGFKPDDFLSCRVSLLERIHPGDSDLTATVFSRTGEPAFGAENLRIRHADGRIRCIRFHFDKQLRDGEVTLNLSLQAAKDLWKPLEDEPQSALFRAMIDNTDDCLFFKDRNHVFTAASPNFRSIVSASLAGGELLGLTDYDFLPESEADLFYRLEKQVLSSGVPSQEVQEFSRPGKEITWIHDRLYPVKNEQSETIGLFAIARNITERMQADERPDEIEESVKESQNISGMGSYVLDVRRGVWTSSTLLDAIFGISKTYPRNIEGWTDLIHPEDRAIMSSYLESHVLGEGKSFNREYRINRFSDQSVRWVHGIGKVDFDAQNTPLVMRGTIQDITDRKLTEIALRETKERLQLFIEHAPAALAMFDKEMRYMAVSLRWLDMEGMSGRDIIGQCHYDIVPDVPERWKEAHRRGLAGESIRNEEDRFERADGTVRWLRWEVMPWHLDNGETGGIVLSIEDVTRAKLVEERLKLAATVFEHASEGIVVTALDGSILEVNETFTRVTGYDRDEVLGRNPRFLQSGRHKPDFYSEMWRSIRETGRWRGELWNRTKIGDLFVVMSTITTVFDANSNPQYYVALFADITPIKEQERKFEHIAHYDALTGLPNRVLLAERLRQAMALPWLPGQVLAVAYFDLDSFKAINDIHGHDAADKLLVAVASHMKANLREGDTLARISGDEFVAVLPELAGTQAAGTLMARVLLAVTDPVLVGDLTLQVSASAGVTFFPQPKDVDADQLLRQADQAMYAAKLAGGNCCHVFDPDQDRTVRSRREELDQIRQALHHDEFVLHYQPKVNMATGALIGAEALIRWQHPERGLLPPGMFLPVIEDHDLIIEVGEWVINTALDQIASWAEMGHRIPISVNLSARHLQKHNFVDRIRALLNAHPNVDPSWLELEVLETSALQDVELVSRVIEDCRGIGMPVAIDDFGTGYSSLTYLKRLPATILKLDQSFVRDMLDDPDDLAILQGVMGLATAFRRVPVAEGVETIGHGVLLLKLGCKFAQGYGIARPMPAADLVPWFAQWRPDPRWKQVAAVSPSDWSVLVAEVELRSWNKAFEDFFKGERNSVPELDERRCRFGAWLEAEKLGYRGALAAMGRAEFLHHQAHQVAHQAVQLKAAGKTSEAMDRLHDTLVLREKVGEQLNLMMLAD